MVDGVVVVGVVVDGVVVEGVVVLGVAVAGIVEPAGGLVIGARWGMVLFIPPGVFVCVGEVFCMGDVGALYGVVFV